MGQAALDLIGEDGDFVPALHSVGHHSLKAKPTWRGRAATPSTSCSSRSRARSGPGGSGYGGNALLGKVLRPAHRIGNGS